MSAKSSIEWTDATWNPVRGCSRVSEGCRNCYAEQVAYRFSGAGQPYEGFAVGTHPQSYHGESGRPRTGVRGRWTGKVELVEKHLADPLRWKKPRRVFVNSMSDLFHEGLSDKYIVAVFAIMAAAPQHTFQILTKRPERMLAWSRWISGFGGLGRYIRGGDGKWLGAFFDSSGLLRTTIIHGRRVRSNSDVWAMVLNAAACNYGDSPLINVWLGVSVEDQATADERIPLLLQTPAAVRFVSYEPALGPVDFAKCIPWVCPAYAEPDEDYRDVGYPSEVRPTTLDWIIVGGESGPHARPFDIAWARSTVAQCKAAGVACFVKQIGRRPTGLPPLAEGWHHIEKKGGDWNEWPADLRVREFPNTAPVPIPGEDSNRGAHNRET